MDWTGLVFTVGFLVAGFAVIPLDRYLDRRRQRRRWMAHPRRPQTAHTPTGGDQ